MRISELSTKFGIPRYHIDYWKKTGLIKADGDILHLSEVARIRFIWECKQHRISLRKIRRALNALDAGPDTGQLANPSRLFVERPGSLLYRRGDDLIEADTGQFFFSLSVDQAPESSEDQSGKIVQFPGKGRVRQQETEKEARLKALEESYFQSLSVASPKKLKEILMQILSEDPDHVGSLIEMGNLEFEAGKIDRSLSFYEKATQVEPDCVEAIYNIANIYFKQEKFAVAIRYFEQCIILDPEFPESYYNLGIVYFRLSYFERSLIFFQKYLELDPDSFWSDQAGQYIEEIEGLKLEIKNRENELFGPTDQGD